MFNWFKPKKNIPSMELSHALENAIKVYDPNRKEISTQTYVININESTHIESCKDRVEKNIRKCLSFFT